LDTGLTSPKVEEIDRMHKEIETLKNLTKILEEKLETLEHIPDNADNGATSARKSLTASTNSGGKLSDSSDGAESSRKKIKPRHAASTPVVPCTFASSSPAQCSLIAIAA
jgi:chromosome segregation ATPase